MTSSAKETVHTFNSLTAYGKYLESREVFQLPDAVLSGGWMRDRECLQFRQVSQIGFIGKIKKYFHVGEFRLATIKKITEKAFAEMDPTTVQFLSTDSRKVSLEKTVTWLNKEIEQHNARLHGIWSVFLRIFGMKSLEKIQIPQLLQRNESNKVDAVPPGSVELAKIPGMVNTGNHCYCNALMQGMRASVGYREMLKKVDEQSSVNITQQALFAEMDKGKEVGCAEGSVYDQFKEAIGTVFNPILDHDQEDAGELLRKVLNETLSRSSILEQGKIDPASTFIRLQEYVFRTKMDGSDTAQVENLRSATIPRPEALTIGHIDRQKPVVPSQMVTMQIPADAFLLDIQDFFGGREVMEQADFSSIVGDKNSNNPWLTPEQQAALKASAANEDEVVFKDIPVVTGTRLAVNSPEEAPSWFPFYIARFTDRKKKNSTPVVSPYILTLPIGEKSSVSYVLKAVVVHEGGESIKGGHYVTYLPVASSKVAEQEMPTKWICANDTRTDELPYEKVGDTLAHNGCIFIYDKVQVSKLRSARSM
jgi:hypothetical protein